MKYCRKIACNKFILTIAQINCQIDVSTILRLRCNVCLEHT